MECRVVPAGENLVGKVMGWLTILEELDRHRLDNGSPKRQFLCKCKCGNDVVRGWDGLKGAKTPSCGCFMVYQTTYNRIKHGMSNTKIFKVWAALKRRCYKEKDHSYHKYGAIGIKVCDRWKSFNNFYEDMGSTYKEGLSLDRFPNQNGDYEPSNCRWATIFQQNRNLKSNRMLTVLGYTKCVSEFNAVIGYPKARINGRLGLGWNDDDAVLGRSENERQINIKILNKHYESNQG